MIPVSVRCPGCRHTFKFTIKSSALDQREAAVSQREAELARVSLTNTNAKRSLACFED